MTCYPNQSQGTRNGNWNKSYTCRLEILPSALRFRLGCKHTRFVTTCRSEHHLHSVQGIRRNWYVGNNAKKKYKQFTSGVKNGYRSRWQRADCTATEANPACWGELCCVCWVTILVASSPLERAYAACTFESQVIENTVPCLVLRQTCMFKYTCKYSLIYTNTHWTHRTEYLQAFCAKAFRRQDL